MTDLANLPPVLAEIAEEFQALDSQSKLEYLIELAEELPDLPEKFQDHPDLLERVIECQSPVYIFVEVDEQNTVHFHATAPRESPTTRAFASIVHQGVNGLTAEQVLAIPEDFVDMLGLKEIISPLRVRGMLGLLVRTKRKVREAIA